MKICLINNLFYPDQKGGAETVVFNIANELKNRNHKVIVICSGKNKEITTEEDYQGMRIYRIGWDKFFSFHDIDNQNIFQRLFWRIHQLHNKYSAKNVRSILQKEKPDLVFSHNTLGLGYNIIKEIEKLKIKHINTIHDVQLIIPSGILKPSTKLNILHSIYSSFTRNIYKKCRYIISPSQKLLDFYAQHNFFENAIKKVVNNPINYQVLEINKKTREELKILYLGQLEEHKGVLNLIKNFKQLNQDKFQLTIAGRGSLSEAIKNIAYVVGNMNFFGEYQEDERKKLLDEHDLLVVPSQCFENSPMVIYEAWLSGTPVLVSNYGGLPELIIENKNGWKFQIDDLNDLKSQLIKIYENREKIPQMSKYCLELVKKFDIKNYVDEILKI